MPWLRVVREAVFVKSSVRFEGQAFDRGDRKEGPQRTRRETTMIFLSVLDTFLFDLGGQLS
jgi:hypothetical protein